MHGCAPLPVAGAGALLAAEHLSGAQWVVIALIAAGVIALGAAAMRLA